MKIIIRQRKSRITSYNVCYTKLLRHLHRINGYDLIVKPFLDINDHGIFATRSPKRPNPIGFSVMKLVGVTASSVQVSGVDVVNNTSYNFV